MQFFCPLGYIPLVVGLPEDANDDAAKCCAYVLNYVLYTTEVDDVVLVELQAMYGKAFARKSRVLDGCKDKALHWLEHDLVPL